MDVNETVKDIKLKAKKKSYSKMSKDFQQYGETDCIRRTNAYTDKDLEIENSYPPPEFYQKKIQEEQDKINKLGKELRKLSGERDQALLARALGGKSNKKHLKKLKRNLKKIREEIDRREGTIEDLQSFADEVREKHEKREKLERYLIAKYLRDEIKENLDELQESYEQFRDSYQVIQQLKRKLDGSNNSNDVEVKLSRDLDISTSGVSADVNYSERAFSSLVQVPDLPEQPNFELNKN